MASIDLVTDTDKACEALIMAALRREFPTFEFMGEETASSGSFGPGFTVQVQYLHTGH